MLFRLQIPASRGIDASLILYYADGMKVCKRRLRDTLSIPTHLRPKMLFIQFPVDQPPKGRNVEWPAKYSASQFLSLQTNLQSYFDPPPRLAIRQRVHDALHSGSTYLGLTSALGTLSAIIHYS